MKPVELETHDIVFPVALGVMDISGNLVDD